MGHNGGALYVEDSECSTHSIECFLSIIVLSYSNSSDYAAKNMLLSLLFFNNSAESTGSILYGGQLNKCRLYYRYSLDECGYNSYSDHALDIFMSMSKIIQYHDESANVKSISSEAVRIKFCHRENTIIDDTVKTGC